MKRVRLLIVLALAATVLEPSAFAQQTVSLYAAGSLSGPMKAIGAAVERDFGIVVTLTSGGSGTLRERIEKGERADLFASANMDHPRALTKAGLSGPTVLFARNTLCAYSRPDIGATSGTLLDRMLDPLVKVGTSTPVADPAGDYAWKLFGLAETMRPGAYAALNAKALKLTGGAPAVPLPATPSGRNASGFLLERRVADIFLLYCSGAPGLVRDLPSVVVIPLPPPLSVGADYGLTVMKTASSAAAVLAQYILSPAGQQILADAGFSPVTLPMDDAVR